MKESLYYPGDILLLAIQPREDTPPKTITLSREIQLTLCLK